MIHSIQNQPRDAVRLVDRVGTNRSRDGIVLLVVLGMLTLFSVLGVSYLVFTSRQRSAAINISRSESRDFDGDQLLGDALSKILVGAKGPESSTWGHDLLGDLYGMRDAVQGSMTPQANFVVADNLVAPNILLNDFIRIPTELFRSATYPNRRDDHTTLSERFYPQTATTTFQTDDELTGRILTFTDGPLAGLSMRVIRYFGDHLTPAPNPTNGRQILSGQLVLDVRPHLSRSITVESLGETFTLAQWISRAQLITSDPDHRYISALFYDRYPETSTGAVPLSEFYLNGRILNGPGLGFDLPRTAVGTTSGTAMNLNETISTNLNPATPFPTAGQIKSGSSFEGSGADTNTDIPVPLQGNYASYRRDPVASPTTAEIGYLQDLPGGDTDEGYDAPDDQNLWLSYFPTDQRLGASAPSFVRPGTLHWIINQQTGNLSSVTPLRLQQILRAVQRSTPRPLRITNDPSMPASIAARANGVMQLDYSNFTGSNVSALGTQIDFNAINLVDLRRMVLALAGQDTDNDGYPDWDVDNNGDGIPDSIWIDAGLPLTEAEDGTLIKPLVSYLVEDLGGRADVNLVGNLVQARGPTVLLKSASGVLYRTGAAAPTSATVAHTDLPAGFGYGPAEINLRPLFAGTSAVGTGPLNLLRRRLNTETYAGVEYVAPGFLIDPITIDGNDFAGMLRQPHLPNLHSTANAMGLPVDKYGRSSISLGIDGGLMVSGASVAVQNAGAAAGDSSDDPYEMNPSPGTQPDDAFTLSDLEGVLRFNDFDRDALDSALVALAENHFTSTIDSNEFANSVTTISNSAAVTTGPLPQEWRDSVAASQNAGGNEALLTTAITTQTSIAPGKNRNALLMQLLPQELLGGGKLDLNRPFGNGVDDDGNGVVDDPNELRTVVQVFYNDFTGTSSNTFYSTAFSDVTIGEPGPYSATPPPGNPFPEPTPQALFARHLYVMAMALTRDLSSAAEFDFTGGTAITIDPTNQTVKESPIGSGTYVPNSGQDEFRAMRLAQWAINVADFRDPDGIMSRFDYDVFPFDGWQISTTTPVTSRTVWGMEYPELALEESIAFHDRRVRDTNLDAAMEERFSGGSFRDTDVDQWRIPQGTLMLEIRSTRSPDYLRVPASDVDNTAQPWGVPTELYSQVDVDPSAAVQNEYMIDLARTAPDRNPVWRVAVTPAHEGPSGDATQSADEMLQPAGSVLGRGFTIAQNRLTATLQPDRPDFFGPVIPLANQVDRVVWFTNVNPDNGFQIDGSTAGNTIGGQVYGDGTAGDGFVDFAPLDSQNIEKIFYNRFATADYPYQIADTYNLTEVHLRGGQYAVVGPRSVTNVGTLQTHSAGGITHDPTTYEPLVPYNQYESTQRFLLTSTTFEHRLFTGTRATPTVATGAANATIRNSVGIIAAANVPTGFTGAPVLGTVQAIGLNVSEPLPYPVAAGTNQYYPSPTSALKAGFPFDAYHDFDAATGTLPDQPFDGRVYAELYKVFGANSEQTGTRERFKTAYLQRLADPTQPHDEINNPYLSVDYITIDLTVFNGSDSNREETDAGPPAVTEWIDNNDPNPFGTAPDEAFATRYKTGHTIFNGAASASTENLSHSVNTYAPQVTGKETLALGGNIPYFDYTLNLQDAVNPDHGGAADSNPNRLAHSSTLGFANASYGDRWRTIGGTDTSYAGTPYSNWFSTATWSNRPYVSPLELMWVPTTSAGGFGAHFGTATLDTNFIAGNVFAGTGAVIGGGERTEYNRVFPHLWNYFSNNAADFTRSPNLHRILDFVDVPAPFDFEVDFLSTNNNIMSGSPVSAAAQSTFGGRFDYSALGGANTTSNPNSWTTTTTTTNAFWLNRFTIEAFRTPLNIRQPQFRHGKINLNTIKSPRVYRALMEGISDSTDTAEGAFFAAFTDSRRGYTPAASSEPIQQVGTTIPQFERTHSNQFSGAFRPANASDLAPLPANRVGPLDRTTMRPTGVTGAFGPDPLFQKPVAANINSAWRQRSVAHHELAITRLNNLAADQSNAFGVWITVGLFKVSGNMMVGDELGSDIGENRRYRAFHVIDRSVPAMYEPGELNNAMETVLLSRKLN